MTIDAKNWWYWVSAAFALAAGGFASGRYATPTKTVTLDRVVEHTISIADTHAEQQVRELTAQLEQLKSQTHTVRTTVTHVDGSKIERETQDVDVERATQVNVNLATNQSAYSHAQVYADRLTTHESTVEHEVPQWFVGAVTTVSPGAPDPIGSISVGALVGRHVVGPLALGLSVSVPVNKPVQMPTFGLSLTVGF